MWNEYKCLPWCKFFSVVELRGNSDIGLRGRLNGKVVIGQNALMMPELLTYIVNHITTRTDIAIKIKKQ